MAGKIGLKLKPTDYTVNNEGNVDYSYPFDELKNDVRSLSESNAQGLKDECNKRWNNFLKFPIPSNYSRYKAAYNLAKELGLDVSLNPQSVSAKNEDKNIVPERGL